MSNREWSSLEHVAGLEGCRGANWDCHGRERYSTEAVAVIFYSTVTDFARLRG